MYLHVISAGEYAHDFISFVNKYYDEQDHFFLITSNKLSEEIYDNNCVIVDSGIIREINLRIKQANRLIIHGLFDNAVLAWIIFHPQYRKKTVVSIWGGEIYNDRIYIENSDSIALRVRLKNFYKGVVLRKIKFFVCDMPGDYRVMQEWYKVKGQMIHAVYPQSLTLDEIFNIRDSVAKDDTVIRVLIGNSARPTNNHIEALNMLAVYKDKDIEVYVPLSYGDKKYREEVIKYGQSKYGNRFIPIVDYMPISEYVGLLSRMDIAIFNCNRQQAMGNIALTALLGCKVFIRKETTMWDFYVNECNCSFEDASGIGCSSWESFVKNDDEHREKNISYFSKLWDDMYIKKMWDKLFKWNEIAYKG